MYKKVEFKDLNDLVKFLNDNKIAPVDIIDIIKPSPDICSTYVLIYYDRKRTCAI